MILFKTLHRELQTCVRSKNSKIHNELVLQPLSLLPESIHLRIKIGRLCS